jgi:hypothetical protein
MLEKLHATILAAALAGICSVCPTPTLAEEGRQEHRNSPSSPIPSKDLAFHPDMGGEFIRSSTCENFIME